MSARMMLQNFITKKSKEAKTHKITIHQGQHPQTLWSQFARLDVDRKWQRSELSRTPSHRQKHSRNPDSHEVLCSGFVCGNRSHLTRLQGGWVNVRTLVGAEVDSGHGDARQDNRVSHAPTCRSLSNPSQKPQIKT